MHHTLVMAGQHTFPRRAHSSHFVVPAPKGVIPTIEYIDTVITGRAILIISALNAGSHDPCVQV